MKKDNMKFLNLMPCAVRRVPLPISVKRLFQFSLLLWGLLILACPSAAEQPIPKSKGLVNDFAQVISPAYEQKIGTITRELLQKTGIPVVVVTMPDIGGAEYNDYANRLYETWGIGKKGEDKGVLIFVTVKERKMRIEVGYGLEGVIPDGLAGEIRDRYMVPYLKKNQFNEGLLNGVLGVTQVIAKAAGVKITGQTAVSTPKKKKSRLSFFPIFLIFLVFMIFSRRRRGSWLLLPLLMGGGLGPRGGGGFGGFSGGFGGFGGGMSGGGGAGGGF
ncbi:MAG: TPM domain-containing protein [Deltaproteobacteria bacterium]|nr:TPM domain-containing protein [Deltaproteobacteria bacterium]